LFGISINLFNSDEQRRKMKMKNRTGMHSVIGIILLVAMALSASSCLTDNKADPRGSYTVIGVVKEVDFKPITAVVDDDKERQIIYDTQVVYIDANGNKRVRLFHGYNDNIIIDEENVFVIDPNDYILRVYQPTESHAKPKRR